MEKKEIRKYSRWFWLGLWSTIITGIIAFAIAGVGVLVYGTSFLLLGRTRLAIGITVIISLVFMVFSFIAHGWGEDLSQKQVKPAKTDIASILIVVVLAVLVLGGVGARMRATGDGAGGGFLGIQIPDIILNLVVPDQGAPDWEPPDWTPPEWTPPENSRAPTGLTVDVSPNTVDMGDWIIGTVTSNGYNWPLQIKVTHKGSGQSMTISGFLGADGKFELVEDVDIPGVYEVTAYTDTESSTPITFVVRGIRVVAERGHYSKTLSDSMLIGVYSHHTHQNAGIVGHYPSGSYSQAISNTVINAGGYGEVAPNLDGLANGDWELDALIGSDSAMAWSGTYWIDVGR